MCDKTLDKNIISDSKFNESGAAMLAKRNKGHHNIKEERILIISLFT